MVRQLQVELGSGGIRKSASQYCRPPRADSAGHGRSFTEQFPTCPGEFSPGARSRALYQLEVKLGLVRICFPPASGWKVHIAVDAMEYGKGRQQSAEKARRASAAARKLEALGARLVNHPLFGPVDIVAEHHEQGTRFIEVEGQSSRQREQALYSALGQLILSMKLQGKSIRYGLAVPATPPWTRQVQKVPPAIARKLALDLYLVAEHGVTCVRAGESIPRWARG